MSPARYDWARQARSSSFRRTSTSVSISDAASGVTTLPIVLPPGGALSVKTINVDKVFPANQPVVLELQDAHDLLFTLKMIIAPKMFAWHIGPGNPKPMPAVP